MKHPLIGREFKCIDADYLSDYFPDLSSNTVFTVIEAVDYSRFSDYLILESKCGRSINTCSDDLDYFREVKE